MCAIIRVSDLQCEAFELLEETSFESTGRIATRRRATQIENEWEMDASEVPEFDLD